uniref:CSON015288 protein n=1 Tax=Culicoides sonorensis TaxID=179676 RepID=A0A336MCX7_CULSO
MCVKKACPVLQCPITKQQKLAGECCPRCTDRMKELHNIPGKCILARGFHPNGKQYNADLCSKCTCHNGTSVCRRNTCPVLECAVEYQEMSGLDCCPRCMRQAEVRSTCKYEGKVYQNNETWSNGPCRSCECRAGEIRCALEQCPATPKCRPNEKLVTVPGQCCSKCVENPAVCTVYGDPHYKTFDGKHYSFQGSCKYQLTADCVDNTFAIRVTNDARNTKHSAWTKTVTLKMGYIKVNLGQKMRVKVNGTRLIEFPYENHGLNITKNKKEGITVDTVIGIRLSWDGNNFLQVEAATKYKNKLCGLCGNYNNIFRDDLQHKNGQNMSDNDVWTFANSWRVGGSKACTRLQDEKKQPQKLPATCQKRFSVKCHPLTVGYTHVFSECQSHLNPQKYFEACAMDMCECPSRFCYCESFTAYARECQRLGIALPNWREQTNCTLQSIQQRTQMAIRQARRHNRKKPWRTHKPHISIPSEISHYSNQNFRSRDIQITNRTPPPIH